VLLDKYGPHLAFGVPGLLMLVATLVFWRGHKVFIAIKPAGWQTYKKDLFSDQGKKAIFNLSIMYVFIAVFWSLFDQTGSSWVLQAERMDKNINLGFVKFELLASQIQAINPLLILIFIPLFTYYVYPKVSKVWQMTALRKISVGLYITAGSFALIAVAQHIIDAGGTPSILWQFFAYVILTIAEVMVSITGLEFSYTQAPNTMKSFIMGLWLLSVSLGNLIAALVNEFVSSLKDPSGNFTALYFWFFVGLMGLTAVLFMFIAMRYKEESYIQDRKDAYPNPILVEN
jgi:POT family proton-dependent oligopeptide transporter